MARLIPEKLAPITQPATISKVMALDGEMLMQLVHVNKNETPVTSTEVIADQTEIQHKNVIAIVRKNIEELELFGGVAFQTRPFDTAGGVQLREYAELNERQATLLITFMRNSEVVKKFKIRLVQEFYKMAEDIKKSSSEPVSPVTGLAPILRDKVALAEIFGITGNQALLSASKATKEITGYDPIALLGVEIKSDKKELTYTPTQLGKEFMGGISAVKVNKALESAGMQTKPVDAWEPTEKGMKFCEVLDTNKKRSGGSPVKQVKWFKSVVSEIGA